MNKKLLGSMVLATLIVGLSLLPGLMDSHQFDQEQPMIHWGGLSQKLVAGGVVDDQRFPEIHNLPEKFNLTEKNAQLVLRALWAFGLANKNEILETGPMMDQHYGGAENFASTGGWTLARGEAMDHYSAHSFITLTEAQQQMVERVSKGIYRPCCNNATHFPDCNHGMAMLGLLQLLASQGVSEQEMWKTALTVNSYWFPDMYLTIASYLKNKGVDWKDLNPQEILGLDYSSASGYRKIASQVTVLGQQGGGSCGI